MSNQGVSNCYVFKSRLQEYAQKVGLPTPVYETIKEGPSHQPSFRSTVVLDDVRYDSLIGFFNRKAAEQSAAEVALVELANAGKLKESVSQPVHETGLCKNLLQEYAQKMNYAIPSYECRKDETQGRVSSFSCTVDIGGMKYIGAAAKTKKEAEIKAARTALLAIRSSPGSNENPMGDSVYTVIPCKKKATDSGISTQETSPALKPKKGSFKKKPQRNRRDGNRGNHIKLENTSYLGVNIGGHEGQQLDEAADDVLIPRHNVESGDGQSTALAFYQNDPGSFNHGITYMFNRDGSTGSTSSGVGEVNTIPGIGQVASMVNSSSSMCQGEVPRVVDGLNQTACGGGAGSKEG